MKTQTILNNNLSLISQTDKTWILNNGTGKGQICTWADLKLNYDNKINLPTSANIKKCPTRSEIKSATNSIYDFDHPNPSNMLIKYSDLSWTMRKPRLNSVTITSIFNYTNYQSILGFEVHWIDDTGNGNYGEYPGLQYDPSSILAPMESSSTIKIYYFSDYATALLLKPFRTTTGDYEGHYQVNIRTSLLNYSISFDIDNTTVNTNKRPLNIQINQYENSDVHSYNRYQWFEGSSSLQISGFMLGLGGFPLNYSSQDFSATIETSWKKLV